MKTMRTGLTICLAGMISAATAAPYVVLQGNRRMEGISIRARADGAVILVTAQGPMEFPRSQIVQAVAVRPAELDHAIRAVHARQFDAAIPVLEKIVQDMRWLTWDEVAVLPLTRALMDKGEPARAVSAFEGVLRYRPDLDKNLDARWLYLRALAAAGKAGDLEPRLNALIQTGPRPEAARAQILRGDLRFAAGQFEAALLDYLRAVRFYEAERALMPEATLKVARSLDKLRDTRAGTWYKKVVDDYPASPEAVEAKGKL